MKTFLYPVVAACLFLLLSQCTRDGLTPQTGSFEKESTLSARQSVRIASATADELTIVVDSIRDSRCPANANCVWAGNAQVWFTASQNQVSRSGKLCTGDCKSSGSHETAEVQFSGKRYEVVLQKVEPYPATTEKQEPPKATLLVRKK